MHGMGRFDVDRLRGRSELGIIASELAGKDTEEQETHYCADFYRVKENQTLQEYMDDFSYRNSGRTAFENPKNSSVTFIINPHKEIEPLMDYDLYSPSVTNESAREIINTSLKVVKEHLKGGEKSGRVSAVLGGIPSNCFSGILVGQEVTVNKDNIDALKSLFPHCYIIESEGVVLYNPNEEVPDELSEKRREAVALRFELEKANRERQSLEMENHALKEERRRQIKAVKKEYPDMASDILKKVFGHQ